VAWPDAAASRSTSALALSTSARMTGTSVAGSASAWLASWRATSNWPRRASSFASVHRGLNPPGEGSAFRLAIGEAVRAPEVARALHSFGRQASRAALTAIMTQAQSKGLLSGRPPEMAEQFAGLLWGDLMISLLLRIVDTPGLRETTRRARSAATAFWQLHPDTSQAPAAQPPSARKT
jgi:hypothetical protein